MVERADSEEKYPDYEVENLAGWYLYLLGAFPDDNARFLTALRSCLNGFHALRFAPEDDGIRRLRAEFMGPTKKKERYSLSDLSDGQRTLIALYMILHFSISKGNTVFIDEPDNYVSLSEIQPWLMAATQEVEDHNGQLILISHHPELLNQWATEYGLRFFREENGHVRTEKFKGDPDGSLHPSELIARGGNLPERVANIIVLCEDQEQQNLIRRYLGCLNFKKSQSEEPPLFVNSGEGRMRIAIRS